MQEVFNSFEFDCVFVDEVHKIKVNYFNEDAFTVGRKFYSNLIIQEPKSRLTKALKSVKCKKRFGLTGTPLQNNILELWCILDWYYIV